MKGVILAGGKGMRLRPLTCNLPKPMLPLLHKPVMEYSLELLRKHGIREVAVTVQYMGAAIRNYFGDGSNWGMKLYYFEDTPPLGTAGSIKQAEEFLDETFVVVSGDALTDFHLLKGMDFHRSTGGMVTIFQKEVANPLNFGLVVTEEEGRVMKYIEKPSWNEVVSNTVNTGIYIIEPSIFSYMKVHTFYDFSHDIFPMLLSKGEPLYGYMSEGYWLDIGTFQNYRQAHFDLLTKKVGISMECTEVFPGVWMGEGARIENGAKIQGPALIGDRVTIKKGAVIHPYTIIGKNSFISEDVQISKSIIGNDVHVGKCSEVNGTIISYGTIIEECVTLFDKSVVADRSVIGKNTVIKSNVKVWPDQIIDGGSVLLSSVTAQEERDASLFYRGDIKGKANIHIKPETIVKIAHAYSIVLTSKATILIGYDCHRYAEIVTRVFMETLHAAGITTRECKYTNDACFRYMISKAHVQGGVFIYVQSNGEVVLRFYDSCGTIISGRFEKEVESAYVLDESKYAEIEHLGINIFYPSQHIEYVSAILKMIRVSSIRQCAFHLCVYQSSALQREMLSHFFQQLHCQITWVDTNPNDVMDMIRSSGADVGMVLQEQGNDFELYDVYGNVYTNIKDTVASHILRHVYPLTIKQRGSYICCSEQEDHSGQFGQDALLQVGKIIEIMAVENAPLHTIVQNRPHFHLLWDEVLCPWKEKGRVMRMLTEEGAQQELEVSEGIKFLYDHGEWSYIISDAQQPKIIVYAQSANAAKARKKILNIIEKIRQYQKV
ncbi:sugar phosphate nucleotidyltransferase [Ectobacillus sp. JY-23]|uniref:sugar phosphate nucleotidyltransferase n=1 Tax=Ectobacillus sp. JY-23 TaxID=2933872 RepID=UPI001FF42C65|nr:sugar phosphate nucleotidyltransferase [Ectobacillus sp. JY-23]UOY94017.1 sugar phosphate nucleotidyltransferase [Ectobacillus sp. JY-23]